MSEIKWVKITTDMFDNPKIKFLRRLSHGNSYVLIWIMLITIAGRCNAGGKIFITDGLPYDNKDLANELGFPENVLKHALQQFEMLDMIEKDGNYIVLTGWEEYQNKEALDKIREQTRKRVAKHRSVTQDVTLQSVTSNVTEPLHVTQCNATDKEEEKDIDIKKTSTNVDVKESRFAPPSLQDIRDYCSERNNDVDPEHFLDYYEARGWILSNGKKCRDWKACVRTWEKKEWRTAPSVPHKSINQQNVEAWAKYLGKENTDDKRTDEELLSLEESDFFIH